MALFSRSAARDPRLEKVIAWVLDELKKTPAASLKRAAFPDKTKTP